MVRRNIVAYCIQEIWLDGEFIIEIDDYTIFHHSRTSNDKSKEASPGPLIFDLKRIEWDPKFEKHLSTSIEFNKVLLSYIIRENGLPDSVKSYENLVDETIAYTPLTCVFFKANRSIVHQYFISFTSGQTSEGWIKPNKRHKNGQRMIQDLRDHFL